MTLDVDPIQKFAFSSSFGTRVAFTFTFDGSSEKCKNIGLIFKIFLSMIGNVLLKLLF